MNSVPLLFLQILIVPSFVSMPSVTNVDLTSPAYKDKVIFGYGDYVSDGSVESGSQFRFLDEDGNILSSGSLNTVFLGHFDDDLVSEEGYSPLQSSGINLIDNGKFGKGIEVYNGDILTYALPEGFNISQGTVEMWVNPSWNSATENEPQHYLFYQEASENDKMYVYYTPGTLGTGILYFYNQGPSGSESLTKAITWKQNEWHHVAITFSNQLAYLSVDGQPTWPLTYFRQSAGSSPRFSLNYPDGTNNFNGIIDELRIMNRALTPKELYETYRLGRPYHSNEQMLDLSNFDSGEQVRFEYKPCNDNGECGSAVQTELVTIQDYISMINIDAGNVLRAVNRDLLGTQTCYDETPMGSMAGWRTWDASVNQHNQITAERASRLRLGLTRIGRPLGYWGEDKDLYDVESWKTVMERMALVGGAWRIASEDASSQPFIVNMYGNTTHYEEEKFLSAQEFQELVYYLNIEKGLNFKYWEPFNEPGGSGMGLLIADYSNEIAASIKDVTLGDPSIKVIVHMSWMTFSDVIANIDPDLIDGFQIHNYMSVRAHDCNMDEFTPEEVDDLYRDFMGTEQYVVDEQRMIRNLVETRIPQDMEIHKTEYNIGSYKDGCDISFTPQTLAGITTAVYRNHIIKDGVLNSAQIFNFEFANPWAILNVNAEKTIPYLIMQMYADFVGDEVVADSVETLSFSATGDQHAQLENENDDDPREGIPALSVLATKSPGKLYLIVINTDRYRNLTTQINLNNYNVQIANVNQLRIDEAYASHNDPLESITVGPYHSDPEFYHPEYIPLVKFFLSVSNSFQYTFPALSITAFEFVGNHSG